MVLKHKKIWASLFLCVALIVPIRKSEAFLPIVLVAGWLLSIGGDAILITDIIAGSTALITGAVWYDCNKFSASPVCNKSASGIPASSAPPGSITVSLTPDATRTNPDPTKFNDPVPPARDVTAKSTISATAPPLPKPPVPDSSSAPVDLGQVSLGPGDDGTNYMFNQSHGNGDAVMMAVLTLSNVGIPNWPTPQNMPVIFQSVVCTGMNAPYPQLNANNAACNAVQLPRFNALQAAYTGAADPTHQVSMGRYRCMANDPSVWCMVFVAQWPMTPAQVATCDNGYTLSGTSCNLSNPTAVRKPSTTPCQILIDPATNNMLNDPLNPNCSGGISVSGSTTNVTSGDGTSMTVAANSAGGFDISKTGADGSVMSASTGPYDATGKGYPITSTESHSKGDNPNGADCGLPGMVSCGISESVDAATAQVGADNQSGHSAAVSSLKGSLDGIDDNKFAWSFIPNIPTAECVEPSIRNPLNDSTITMPICDSFNSVSLFINGVLGFLTVLGCVHQVRTAMAA